LAEPEEFILPEPHPLWSPANYDSFNLSKSLEVKDKSVRFIYFQYFFLFLLFKDVFCFVKKPNNEAVQPPKEMPM